MCLKTQFRFNSLNDRRHFTSLKQESPDTTAKIQYAFSNQRKLKTAKSALVIHLCIAQPCFNGEGLITMHPGFLIVLRPDMVKRRQKHQTTGVALKDFEVGIVPYAAKAFAIRG